MAWTYFTDQLEPEDSLTIDQRNELLDAVSERLKVAGSEVDEVYLSARKASRVMSVRLRHKTGTQWQTSSALNALKGIQRSYVRDPSSNPALTPSGDRNFELHLAPTYPGKSAIGLACDGLGFSKSRFNAVNSSIERLTADYFNALKGTIQILSTVGQPCRLVGSGRYNANALTWADVASAWTSLSRRSADVRDWNWASSEYPWDMGVVSAGSGSLSPDSPMYMQNFRGGSDPSFGSGYATRGSIRLFSPLPTGFSFKASLWIYAERASGPNDHFVGGPISVGGVSASLVEDGWINIASSSVNPSVVLAAHDDISAYDPGASDTDDRWTTLVRIPFVDATPDWTHP